MSEIILNEKSTVLVPNTGKVKIFVDSADGHVKQIDDNGDIIDLAVQASALFDYIQFNIAAGDPATIEEGMVWWNSDDKTLNIKTNTNTIIQVGQEHVLRSTNKTGSTIPNGKVVYVNGAQGNRPTIDLADADSDNATKTIALTTEEFLNNATGFITSSGLVRDIDTSAFLEGDRLWLSSTAGEFTNVEPPLPAYSICVGYCIYSHVDEGVVLVRVDHKRSLKNLKDVDVTGIADGMILRYNSTTQKFEVVARAHNTNTSIQGGTIGEYYHLTSAQHTIATQAATGSLSGYLTSTDWATFNSKVSSQWVTSGSDIYYNTGNVGIGATPTARVHIKGSGATSATKALKIENSSSVALFEVLDDGKLDGKNISLGIYAGTMKIGEGASPSGTGTYAMSIGYQAAYSTTTASGFAAIGYQAGYSAIHKSNWLAIGYQAGYANNTGDTWLAIGYNAAKLNSSGSYFAAIGRFAAFSNVSGSSWVALGRDAAFYNQSGSAWQAVGFQAGYNNLAGNYWVALGTYAGKYITGTSTPLEYFTESVYVGYNTKGTNGTVGIPTINENVFGNAAEGRGSNTVAIGSSSVTDQYLNGMVHSQGCYASIHVHDSTTAQSIPTGTTYTKVTAFTDNGLSANCTPDVTNDKITFTKTGIYKVSCTTNFVSGTANVIFWMAPFLNGVEQNQTHIKRKISTAGDVGSATMVGLIDVTSTSIDLDIRARHDNAGAVDLTVQYANLTVEYLGET